MCSKPSVHVLLHVAVHLLSLVSALLNLRACLLCVQGMMTGQILGGSDPSVASRYQIVIYFLVAISSSASAIATIYSAVLTICDGRHRLRAEKLVPRASRAKGAFAWIGEQAVHGWRQTKRAFIQGASRLRRAVQPRPASRERHSYFGFRGGRSMGPGAAPVAPSAEERTDDIERLLLSSDDEQ